MSESIQTESTRISVSGNEADEEDDDCAFFPDTRNADVVSMATDEAPNSSEAILPDLTPSSSSRWSDDVLHTLDTQSSIVDGLLTEIYDRWHFHPIDSDTFTESSVISDAFCGHRSDCSVSNIPGFEQRHAARLHRAFLETKGISQSGIFLGNGCHSNRSENPHADRTNELL
ncbi:hypothetical protein CAPTEDRAFT_197389 [Capitella teleta]|uniref:Uncharacterized protein n=1 Tax=Capitella teleta TaxID=283909 RepID=R7TP83_CAPTE|nr:hypothetical protein CAPTEDRAFT_197389 [Capitella teleta]|eukprot:ELT95708.1 hypothetical protein CAPTEDRAFT_197389 [Capitella teleta]